MIIDYSVSVGQARHCDKSMEGSVAPMVENHSSSLHLCSIYTLMSDLATYSS